MIGGKRYSEIEKQVEYIYEDFNITDLPVDVFLLAEKMGIVLIPFSKLKNDAQDALFKSSVEGISNLSLSENRVYKIWYNDFTSKQRQRFTIAHELGHIQLNHYTDPFFTNQSKEYLDEEADAFASRLLVPVSLINLFGLKSEEDIAARFNVSYECASCALKRYESAMNYSYVRHLIASSPIAAMYERSYKEELINADCS